MLLSDNLTASTTSHDGTNHTGNYTAYLDAVAAAQHRSHHIREQQRVCTDQRHRALRQPHSAPERHAPPRRLPCRRERTPQQKRQPLRVSNPLPVGACLAAECVTSDVGVVAAGNPPSCAAHHTVVAAQA